MIVSITVVTKLDPFSLGVAKPTPGMSPGAGGSALVVVEPTVGTSPVTDEPTPGMSPANAVTERTDTSAIAVKSLFIDCLLILS
jgi:hypothetical protein